MTSAWNSHHGLGKFPAKPATTTVTQFLLKLLCIINDFLKRSPQPQNKSETSNRIKNICTKKQYTQSKQTKQMRFPIPPALLLSIL